MKKIIVYSEVSYLFAIITLSFAVAMISSTGFGVSMIVAPAYILSLKVPFLTFGQAEYVIQGLLFLIFCVLNKKFKPIYLTSFITGLIYGGVLDLWRLIIPHFNPNITTVGSFSLWLRIIYLIIGMLLTAISIALFFRTYLYPQVYDFFVKAISQKFGISTTKFKIGFDATFLVLSFIMSFAFFEKINGIGIATVIMTLFNGMLIGFVGKIIDKYFVFKPRFEKLADKFVI